MTILCDKDEFALLVRKCQRNETFENCRGCLFNGLCGVADEKIIMDSIEDICVIDPAE